MHGFTNVRFAVALCAMLSTPSAIAADIDSQATAQQLGLMQGLPVAEEKRVNWVNWFTFPYSRWGFQHVREVMPTVALQASAKAKPLPERFDNERIEKLTFSGDDGQVQSIRQMLDSTYTDAFLVLHKGKIVFEHYDNGMAKDSQHIVFSVTKSFTGLIFDSLVEEGMIDPDKTPADYVPELKSSVYAQTTIQQVRDMLINADFSEVYDDPESSIVEYTQALGFLPTAKNTFQLEFLANIQGTPPHGEKFLYKSIHTDVLAWIARRVTGQSLRDLLQQRLWDKIGMRYPAYLAVNGRGIAPASAGLNITARDLSRLGLMLLGNGRYEGRRVIAKSLIDEIKRGGSAEAYNAGGSNVRRPGFTYHNQWWVQRNEHKAFAAMGVFGQRLYVNPKADVVIVKMSSRPDGVKAEMDRDFDASMHAIALSFIKP